MDLFGNDSAAPAPKPVKTRPDPTSPEQAWESEKMIGRGAHPATLLQGLVTGSTCGSCRFFEGDDRLPARCRQAGVNTKPAWPACQLYGDWSSVEIAARGQTGVLHPPTSRRAGDRVKAGSQQAQILRAIADSPVGLTAREAGEVIDRSTNQCGSRLLELRRLGLVRHVGPGDPIEQERYGAAVHVLTAAGEREAVRLSV